MSCPNNCNSDCNCNQCCPPAPIPLPPTPPVCEGTNCTEVYDGACVQYTGTDLSCLGIKSGFSLNTIVQLFANQICDCCSKPKCKNPLEFLFEYITDLVIAIPTVKPQDLLNNVLDKGLVIPTCGLCCPDAEIWSIANDRTTNNILAYIDNQYNIGRDINIAFNDCYKKFLTATDPADPTVFLYADLVNTYGIGELGSILAGTQLCTVFDFIQQYNSDSIFATEIFKKIFENGIVISCIGNNSEMFIGNYKSFQWYYDNTPKDCACGLVAGPIK